MATSSNRVSKGRIMKFYIYEHQHKGRPYKEALTANGWTLSEYGSDPEMNLAMFDHDTNGSKGYRKPLEFLKSIGVPVVMYPHAARPNVTWDGMYTPWPHTALQIIIAPGHREVLNAYGYPLPMAETGWAMCEQRPFVATPNPRSEINVLFAPIHPNANGWLHPVNQAMNAVVFMRLVQTPGIRLTVRHILRMDFSGLWAEPGVNYVVANPNGKTDEIDAADVVIAHQTFAYMAVARGKPLIMFGDDFPANSGNAFDNMKWAKHYEAYRSLMRYPIEAEEARSSQQMRKLIERAMGEDAGKKWRKKFIGEQMDSKKFSALMETLI